MLDFDTALELLKTYGYSSATAHPYIYESGESIGICYSYTDEDYGTLERIITFQTKEEMEEYLKAQEWVKTNGLNRHVRMILDNYESINPKILYLRNEKLMVEGEMYDIDNYDYRESQRKQMDDISKIIYEAGDILLVYDEIKSKQLEYFRSLTSLKNELKQKYFDLQKEVDSYNNIKLERTLNLLPNVPDSGGIDEMLEIATKDRYNLYLSQMPSTIEEATSFLKEVWDMTKNLELNVRYYDAIKEDTDIRNEIVSVDKKMELMKNLNSNLKPLFGTDLVGRFRKINKECSSKTSPISEEFIQSKMDIINKKYSMFDNIELLYTSEYLREGIQNTNYDELSIKYKKGTTEETINKMKTPLHDIAANLSTQYKERLNVDEQAILVLYNNPKYRKLFNYISSVENYETIETKKLIKQLNSNKGFSKLKSECFGIIKKRIEDPINSQIKASLFKNINFESFETFISSLVQELQKLKNVNNKMTISGDINMYFLVKDIDDVKNQKFINLTSDLNTLLSLAKEYNSMIGLALIKEDVPVLHSPYTFDFGDIYAKDASPKMEIKNNITFELIIENSDINISTDPNKVKVVNYHATPKVVVDTSVVSQLDSLGTYTFCKYVFSTNIANVPVPETTPVQVVPEQVTTPEPVPETAPVTQAPETSVPITEPVTLATEPQTEVEQKTIVETSPTIKEEVKTEVPTVPKAEVKTAVSTTSKVEIKKETSTSAPIKKEVPKVVETKVPETSKVATTQPVTKKVEASPSSKPVTVTKPAATPKAVNATPIAAVTKKVETTTTTPVKTVVKKVVKTVSKPVTPVVKVENKTTVPTTPKVEVKKVASTTEASTKPVTKKVVVTKISQPQTNIKK